jgi:hypothetical protein
VPCSVRAGQRQLKGELERARAACHEAQQKLLRLQSAPQVPDGRRPPVAVTAAAGTQTLLVGRVVADDEHRLLVVSTESAERAFAEEREGLTQRLTDAADNLLAKGLTAQTLAQELAQAERSRGAAVTRLAEVQRPLRPFWRPI